MYKDFCRNTNYSSTLWHRFIYQSTGAHYCIFPYNQAFLTSSYQGGTHSDISPILNYRKHPLLPKLYKTFWFTKD